MTENLTKTMSQLAQNWNVSMSRLIVEDLILDLKVCALK